MAVQIFDIATMKDSHYILFLYKLVWEFTENDGKMTLLGESEGALLDCRFLV